MSNPYYTPSGVPATQTRGVSANMRSEFESVAVGFDDVYAEILALAAEIGVPTNVTEVPVASSSITDIGDNNGPVILITGTNTITSFGTHYKGGIFIRFAGILTLTHSSSLVLPGAANITTAANDICIAVPIGNPASGWRVMAYCRMSKPMLDDDAIRASVNYADPSWLTALAWSKITDKPTTIAGYGITDAPTKTGTGASGDWPINITGYAESAGASTDIASAATLDLTGRTGNIVLITGTTATSAVTMNNGDQVTCVAVGAWPLTYHATNMPLQTGANFTCAAGDMVIFTKDGSGALTVEIVPKKLGPAFKAYKTTDQTFGVPASPPGTKVSFNTEAIDSNGCFNTSTSRFTPNVRGLYRISFKGTTYQDTGGTANDLSVSIVVNGTAVSTLVVSDNTVNRRNISFSELVSLNGSTDYVEIYVTNAYTGSVSSVIPGGSVSGAKFSGELVR